jgi:hypothetical protein
LLLLEDMAILSRKQEVRNEIMFQFLSFTCIHLEEFPTSERITITPREFFLKRLRCSGLAQACQMVFFLLAFK